MSCERNQNRASQGACKNGISRLASKTANFLGRVTGLNFIGRKIRKASKAMQKEQKEALERYVQTIKDPARKKAAVGLQEKYIGTRITENRLAEAIDETGTILTARHLSENTWMVIGSLGGVVYEDQENGALTIQAMTAKFGKEVQLQKNLTSAKQVGQSRIKKKKSWDPLREGQRLAKYVKNPDYKKSAVELQKKVDTRMPWQRLLPTMMPLDAKGSGRISGNIWQMNGPLGHVIYSDLGKGRVSIEAIMPEIGKEMQFRDSLNKKP